MADIAVTGYEGEYYENGIYCNKLDTFGRTSGDIMYWLDLAEYDDGTTVWPAQYGWWSGDGAADYNGTSLEAGEGLWLTMPNNTLKIQTSGQVLSESLPVVLVQGKQLCPNPTPVELALGQAWITGYEGEYYENGIYCNKLDTFGRTSGDIMYWLDLAEYDDGTTIWPAQYGWWSGDGATDYSETATLNPGEAVWLTSPDATKVLNWPNPLAL